jgi:hypothetical protein
MFHFSLTPTEWSTRFLRDRENGPPERVVRPRANRMKISGSLILYFLRLEIFPQKQGFSWQKHASKLGVANNRFSVRSFLGKKDLDPISPGLGDPIFLTISPEGISRRGGAGLGSRGPNPLLFAECKLPSRLGSVHSQTIRPSHQSISKMYAPTPQGPSKLRIPKLPGKP